VDDVITLLLRLCLAGPILYIALLMIVEPAVIDSCVRHIHVHLHDFTGRPRWPDSLPDSPTARGFVRTCGFLLAIFAIWLLAGASILLQ
jgi:hypothetical protein